MKNTFNERATEVKISLEKNGGVAPKKDAVVKEGTLSAKVIKDSIVVDLKAAVKELDSLRSSTNDRKAVEISMEQYAKEKWGFGSLDSFYGAIGVNPSFHTIESFNTSPEFNENYRWLIPEVIREAVRLGLRKNPAYPNLIAAEETVTQPTVVMPAINMSDAMPKKLSEIETIPTGTVSFGQKKINLTKIGTGIKISDEVNQYVSLNVLSVYLQDVGIKLGIGLDNLAIDTLINGDQADGSLSAPVIGVANTTNGVTYYDLLRAWIRMGRIGRIPQRMLSNENIALDILNLPEFKGFAGQAKVDQKLMLDTPVPSVNRYTIHGAMPANNQVMMIDTTSALIKFNSSALRVEAERIVERGLNATYVTMTTGFANLFRDGRVIIDKSLAYSANGFPTWMDVSAVETENLK